MAELRTETITGGRPGSGAHRVVALCGPYLSGKTSLLESILYATGAIGRRGSTRAGTSIGDGAAEARKRGMGTEINVASVDYLGDQWTFLDVPGSIEFQHDAFAALAVCDAAVLVCEPSPGRVMALTPLIKAIEDRHIPHIIFVNKIDSAEVRVRDLLSALQSVSRRKLVLRQVPIRRAAADGSEETVGYVDLAIAAPTGGRLRTNISRAAGGIKGTFRIARSTPATLDELGLPKELAKVVNHHQGLVVIAGPSGHGKTTTLSALVDLVNIQPVAPEQLACKPQRTCRVLVGLPIGVAGYAHHQGIGVPLLDELADAGEARIPGFANGAQRAAPAQQRVSSGHAHALQAEVEGQVRQHTVAASWGRCGAAHGTAPRGAAWHLARPGTCAHHLMRARLPG